MIFKNHRQLFFLKPGSIQQTDCVGASDTIGHNCFKKSQKGVAVGE